MASGIIPTGNESDDLGIIALLWKKIFTKDLGDVADECSTWFDKNKANLKTDVELLGEE